jgi:hypothetical protein
MAFVLWWTSAEHRRIDELQKQGECCDATLELAACVFCCLATTLWTYMHECFVRSACA